VQLIAAWRDAAGVNFPLWYQYAAVAFGWDPEGRAFEQSKEQGASAYPDDVDASLWSELHRIAADLDAEHDAGEREDAPRLDLATSFQDPVFAGKVAAQLKEDNGGITPTFKIPTGFCKDKRTGKRRLMRPCGPGKRQEADGTWTYLDPLTGVRRPCDGAGDCPPELVDDPVTHAGKQLLPLVLILGAVWWFARKHPRRRRRN
jgi:hypothetical protein